MSFDINYGIMRYGCIVSIPFEQGDVFRHSDKNRYVVAKKVSIPFEQGDVFRL